MISKKHSNVDQRKFKNNIFLRYPSVLALSLKKNVYAKLKGVFNKENFDRFLNIPIHF
jgi:hypothetical protein